MKSRDSKRGIFTPIASVWRWLWAPRKNPHAIEERADQRRREKRRRGAPTSARNPGKIKPTSSNKPPELAYVDKGGNVRLTDGGRIVARAVKGSKTAALADAAALYEQRARELSDLETALAPTSPSLTHLEPRVAQLKTDLKDAPGLGDLDALEARFTALETALETHTQDQWSRKRDIIGRLEALSKASPSVLTDQMAVLSEEWMQSGSAGAVHDTVLERRYAAAREAAEKRAHIAAKQPEFFVAERQAVLDELVELMASTRRKDMQSKLQGLLAAWQEAGGPDDAAMDQRFNQMTAAVEQDIDTLESETQSLRTALEAEASALEQAFDDLSADGDALSEGRDLRGLTQSVTTLEAKSGSNNRDITDKLRRRIDDLQWRADREIERRRTQVATLAHDARQHLDRAKEIPAEIVTLKEWRTVEDAAKAGMDSAETALTAMRNLGRVAADEASQIGSDLRDARKAINEARKAFFETLDESRETNTFRKRALLDRLSHPPLGATVKELDEHVDAVMGDWKQAGSAGRDTDQALWAEFQDMRAGIRSLRDEAAAAERDDFGARLAEAFTRKRELSYTLEDEIRIGKLVLENTKDAKFEKELKRKERRLVDLRKDLSDIQRKLSKLSKTKAPSAAEAKSEQPTDHAA